MASPGDRPPIAKVVTKLQQDPTNPAPDASPSTSSNDQQQAGPSGLQKSCQVCNKTFTTIEKLTRHCKRHETSPPFKCEQCKKVFSSKFKLVRHTLIHSDRKPFSCTVCERTFYRKDHLKNHIKIHSPSKKIYVCKRGVCKKEYTSHLSYRKHLAVHAAEDGNLTCQICYKKFETKDEILYHLKVHAGSRTVKDPNEKKFFCEHCERRFFTKKDVRRHLVVHTGLREFLCQFCPQRFGRKDHLVRHIKKSHNQQEQISVSRDDEEEFSDLNLIPIDDVLSDSELQNLFDSGIEKDDLKDFSVTTGSSSFDSSSELEKLMVGGDELTEEKNLRLPAFSKTFQPPPPT